MMLTPIVDELGQSPDDQERAWPEKVSQVRHLEVISATPSHPLTHSRHSLVDCHLCLANTAGEVVGIDQTLGRYSSFRSGVLWCLISAKTMDSTSPLVRSKASARFPSPAMEWPFTICSSFSSDQEVKSYVPRPAPRTQGLASKNCDGAVSVDRPFPYDPPAIMLGHGASNATAYAGSLATGRTDELPRSRLQRDILLTLRRHPP